MSASSTWPLRLSQNEMLFKHSKEVLSVQVDINDIMLYQNMDLNDELLELLASNLANNNPSNILLTAGGISAIELLINKFVDKDHPLYIPHPTYSEIYNKTPYINKIDINLDGECTMHLFDDVQNGGVIYVCNPNNPTGATWDTREILEFADSHPTITLLVDEVYFDFMQAENNAISCINFVNDYANVYVIKSFSKAYGLAGIRLGYICSNAGNIKHLSNKYGHLHVTQLAKKYGIAVLKSLDHYNGVIRASNEVKHHICDFLKERGIWHIKTSANFILIYVGEHVADIIKNLRQYDGIEVRDMQSTYGLNGFFRVNTLSDYALFTDAFSKYTTICDTKKPLRLWYINSYQRYRLKKILKSVLSVLHEYDIKYWADSGTLLGIARSNSIIPWDDDADLCMLHRDLDSVLSIPKSAWEQQNIVMTRNRFNTYWQFRFIDEVSYPLEEFYTSDKYDLTHIDLFTVEDRGESYLVNTDERFTYDSTYDDSGVCCKMTHNDIFPLTRSYIDDIIINVPKNIKTIIRRTVGDNYDSKILVRGGNGETIEYAG